MTTRPENDIAKPDDRLIMIVGGFGSGKTEISVNLAIHLSRAGRRVELADLDLVNPYFRSREAKSSMERHGVRVVVPPGAQMWADLPIVLPELRGMLHPREGTVSIFDVGGDDVGARALGGFRPDLSEGSYELWQVINRNRPFTDTVEGCLAIRERLEQASRFRVTGLLANSHLIEETDAGTVLQGWRLTREVSRRSGLPVRCVALMEDLADSPELNEIDAPLLWLRRRMLPPWLRREGAKDVTDSPERAARPAPLGVPVPAAEEGHRGQNRR